MISLPVLLSLSLLPFVASQSSNDTTLQIAAIKAHFTQSEIVPDLLSSFDPSAILTVNFEGVGNITPGQALSQDQVGTAPTVTVTAANSSVGLSGNFTLAMVDADVVGTKNAQVTRHWLVNGDTISNDALSNSSATAITSYAGPAPAEGSGAHRYVILLYQQPSTFTSPAGYTENIGVSTFDLASYLSDSGMGSLIAGTYMTVEQGTSTVSVSATSSVITSTLSVASSTHASSSGASSASGSAASTSTSAGSTSGSNGALSNGVGMVVAGIGGLVVGLQAFA
ncbi:PEBP-like protein [Guyanagaster necrorhizus]|uniref:PEBP-like protein n=1 Tax=Guyanagaster necrorhizus TaxID=856835 RepID=A0A9P7W698_9AGAR|nr:PEBP-like protein [Guyanagaster necrorhizus MCA 3950]KAG7452730.1 PEBP-like protein [Guyanagaster necrorhizus MCA 3950]